MEEVSFIRLPRVTPPRDLGALARAEGFACGAEIPAQQWQTVACEGTPEPRLRLVFERLRCLLVSAMGEPGADRMRALLFEREWDKIRTAQRRALLVHGRASERDAIGPSRVPSDFARRVAAGARGVAPCGLTAALDLPRVGGRSSLVLGTVTAHGIGHARRIVLTLDLDPDLSWATRLAAVV
jgi:hypothetical protein